MKKIKITLSTLALFIALGINAQNNHSTINKLEVGYKSAPASASNGLLDIKCTPQATITLQPNSNVNRVYFTIKNLDNNQIVYQVNYLLSSAPVVNIDNVKLFDFSNSSLFISTGQLVTLKPYLYEIQTADSQNNLTTVYSETK